MLVEDVDLYKQARPRGTAGLWSAEMLLFLNAIFSLPTPARASDLLYASSFSICLIHSFPKGFICDKCRQDLSKMTLEPSTRNSPSGENSITAGILLSSHAANTFLGVQNFSAGLAADTYNRTQPF